MKKAFLFLTFALLLTGCGKSGAQLDSADEKDSRVQKGLELVRQKDMNGAIQQFETALTKKPELGLPDLELAMIYQQKKNFARAIYHYERYLEKRPLTEKRPLIQNWIKQAKISLSREVSGDSSEELARLTRENNMLRKQLEAAGRASAATVAHVKTLPTDPPPARPAPVPVVAPVVEKAPPAPAPTPVRTYQVRSGDTLMRIAGVLYGDASQWKKIYEANRDAMKSESDIKVGQTLLIPTL